MQNCLWGTTIDATAKHSIAKVQTYIVVGWLKGKTTRVEDKNTKMKDNHPKVEDKNPKVMDLSRKVDAHPPKDGWGQRAYR